jgi:hypothetical protein
MREKGWEGRVREEECEGDTELSSPESQQAAASKQRQQ